MSFGRKESLTSNQSNAGAKCAVCQKIKYQLRNRKSKLTGQPMFVCNDCFAGKYEPRWLVILVGQSEGIEAVQNYLLNHAYVGKEITAVDLIK